MTEGSTLSSDRKKVPAPRKHNRSTVDKEEVCCVIDGTLYLPKEVESALNKAGGLDEIMKSLPPASNLEVDAGRHRALADPTRLSILHSLTKCDLCPCLLKEITKLSDSKLSYHLNVLEKAGFIGSFAQHKWRIYVLTDLGRSMIR